MAPFTASWTSVPSRPCRCRSASSSGRGRQPAVSPAFKRIIVAKDPELFQLARTFTIQQGLAGTSQPVVVASMEEAIALLAVDEPNFEPLSMRPQL